MDIWNRLTAVQGEGVGGTGWKKVKQLAKGHICITHKYRQQCGDCQGWGGVAEWKWAKGEGWGQL